MTETESQPAPVDRPRSPEGESQESMSPGHARVTLATINTRYLREEAQMVSDADKEAVKTITPESTRPIVEASNKISLEAASDIGNKKWNEITSQVLRNSIADSVQESVRSERITALRNVGVTFEEGQTGFHDGVEAFREKYVDYQSRDIEGFVKTITSDLRNDQGVVDMQALEKRFAAIKPLLGAFGGADEQQIVLENARLYAVTTQEQARKDQIAEAAATAASQVLPEEDKPWMKKLRDKLLTTADETHTDDGNNTPPPPEPPPPPQEPPRQPEPPVRPEPGTPPVPEPTGSEPPEPQPSQQQEPPAESGSSEPPVQPEPLPGPPPSPRQEPRPSSEPPVPDRPTTREPAEPVEPGTPPPLPEPQTGSEPLPGPLPARRPAWEQATEIPRTSTTANPDEAEQDLVPPAPGPDNNGQQSNEGEDAGDRHPPRPENATVVDVTDPPIDLEDLPSPNGSGPDISVPEPRTRGEFAGDDDPTGRFAPDFLNTDPPTDRIPITENPDLTEDELKLFRDVLAYGDVNPLSPDQAREFVTKYPMARYYTRELQSMQEEYGPDYVARVGSQSIKDLSNELAHLGIKPSEYAGSQSWFLWHAAKERFLAKHPDIQASMPNAGKYHPEDPFLSEKARRGIIDTMLGWEIYQWQRNQHEAQRGGRWSRFLSSLPILGSQSQQTENNEMESFMNRVEPDNRDELRELLNQPPKDNRTLASYQLLRIAQLATELPRS